MSRINRVPLGLQDLLGSQNFGDNPSELGSVVAPTLDMTNFLRAERRWFAQASAFAIAVDGQVTAIQVPQGEIWYVNAFAMGVAGTGAPAGNWTMRGSVYARYVVNSNATPATSIHPICDLGYYAPNASEIVSSGFLVLDKQMAHPMPFFGGEEILFYFDGGTYGGRSYTAITNVQYTKVLV